MKEKFVEGLYESIVLDNTRIYKNLFQNTVIDKRTIEYWKVALGFYKELSDENKEILFKIIEQVMIDTVSNLLGIIDGAVTLKNCDIERKLLLNGEETEGELQDLFLEFIENKE